MATNAPARLRLPIGDRDQSRGPTDAPVTLVEYGNYECPYCRRAEYAVNDIRERTGNQVRWVYRHFPNRAVHPQPMLAAEAAGAQAKDKRGLIDLRLHRWLGLTGMGRRRC